MVDFSISQSSQKELLLLARKSIEQYLTNREVIDFAIDDNKELLQLAAVFVTLTENDDLRGCIGTVEPQYPLCEAVIRMSLSAAFNDSRFYPVAPDELARIKIEISVLSPMSKIKSAEEVIPGKHGVLLRRNGRSGLFLPQVWEHFESKEEFLGELSSQKAGLPKNAWKEKETELFVFTVFSFEDK